MMISLRSLCKQFPGSGSAAVADVSLNLEAGRFLAIVGRSGSGKSTLLAMAGGISRPTSGSVEIDDTDLWQLDEDARSHYRNRKIGFVFQFASLLPTLRAIDNVALPALVGGTLGYREAYARARALLERVGLAERLESYPAQLSGGEQRRAAIARALVNAPGVLLADEPTADLDEETEADILNLLIDLHRSLGLTLVVVTHNPDIAARADQVLAMRAGRAVWVEACPPAAADGACTKACAPPAGFDADRGAAARRPDGSLTACAVGSGARSTQITSIFRHPPEFPVDDAVRLGTGIDRFVGRLVLCTIPVVAVTWGINAAVAMCERTVIEARTHERLALEELAMQGLRADIKDVGFGPGETYVLSLYLRNTSADRPMYVMSPAVRGFVQVGSNWHEIPLKAVGQEAPKVERIKGEKIYRYVLEPDVRDFAELIPYYMHVRISNEMLISPSSQPTGNLIERSDNYYIYLKPHNADDRAILAKLKFPGVPPVWIPMPPH